MQTSGFLGVGDGAGKGGREGEMTNPHKEIWGDDKFVLDFADIFIGAFMCQHL